MDAKIIKFSNENKTMRIFTAIGIILIVAGHLQCDVFSFLGYFPYYSFHVMIFLFVSGYFISPKADLKKFILRKVRRLLIPYFIFNLIYGILSTFLNYKGIYVGQGISIYNLFIAPFLGGHQFMFNSPAWFVPALFVTEVVYLVSSQLLNLMLKVLDDERRNLLVDMILLLGYLVLGIIAVALAIGGHAWGFYKTIGRWLLMLPFISLGRVYKAYIQGKIRAVARRLINKGFSVYLLYALYFVVVILGQIILVKNTEGLNISVVWCTSFGNGPIIPFIAACLGMAFWYGVASVCARIPNVEPVLAIGRHSYAVMTHHLFFLFVINSICLRFCNNSESFDLTRYGTDIFYQYMYLGDVLTPVVNLIICVAVPVLIGVLWRKMRQYVKI